MLDRMRVRRSRTMSGFTGVSTSSCTAFLLRLFAIRLLLGGARRRLGGLLVSLAVLESVSPATTRASFFPSLFFSSF